MSIRVSTPAMALLRPTSSGCAAPPGQALLQLGDPATHGQFPFGALDGDQQLLCFERLDQVIVGAAIDQPDRVVDVAEGGDQDHERGESRDILDPFQQGDAVHRRHADVADDQLKGLFGEAVESLFAVSGCRYGIASFTENISKQFPHLRLVVDNQDA
nr:hypothetical protein [Geothermobacter hydrogeniphilus]